MAKAGDEYQELVGAVAKALDPGATVNVGQWIVGPDGRRDLDVDVRGTIEGVPFFVQIECKDWSVPVGIAVVDALDSKRRDLGANKSIIYSNSGFTEPALRKASRVGIEMASALKAGDTRIHVEVHKELVAKRLSIDTFRVVVHPPPKYEPGLPIGWDFDKLYLNKLPFRNWVSLLSGKILQESGRTGQLTFRCTLRPHSGWTYDEMHVDVAAIQIHFECSHCWVSQIVREDVTLGYYDHLRRTVTIPSGQGYYLGLIDRDAWQSFDQEQEIKELEPGTFEVHLTLLNHVPPIKGIGTPSLEEIIIEQEIVAVA